MLCDGKGRPRKIILTGGERSDCKQALPLIEGEKAQAIVADKGYDTDEILDAIAIMGAEAVIPPSKRRKLLRGYNVELHKQRNLIERLFSKLKHYRRVATRYDKTALAFLSFIHLAGIIIWIN